MVTKMIISKSAKRRNTSKGLQFTQEVVYNTKLGKKTTSVTKHEICN